MTTSATEHQHADVGRRNRNDGSPPMPPYPWGHDRQPVPGEWIEWFLVLSMRQREHAVANLLTFARRGVTCTMALHEELLTASADTLANAHRLPGRHARRRPDHLQHRDPRGRPTMKQLALLVLIVPFLTINSHAATDPRPIAPKGCISIPELQHLPKRATRQQIDRLTQATGNAVDYHSATSPPHRFVVVFYRSCEAPSVDYARVEILYHRHTPTRTAYRATLVMTNVIGSPS